MIPNEVNYIYRGLELEITGLKPETEGQDYEAGYFCINSKVVISRKAKVTPKKIGQFVTLWKRDEDGVTCPLSINEDFSLVIINVVREGLCGQFIFPKDILEEKKIISSKRSTGKRGFRLYAPWDEPESKQAMTSKKWQVKYFLDFKLDKKILMRKAAELYHGVLDE